MWKKQKVICVFFFFTATAPTEIYTLSLRDALPISFRDRPGTKFMSHGSQNCWGLGVCRVEKGDEYVKSDFRC